MWKHHQSWKWHNHTIRWHLNLLWYVRHFITSVKSVHLPRPSPSPHHLRETPQKLTVHEVVLIGGPTLCLRGIPLLVHMWLGDGHHLLHLSPITLSLVNYQASCHCSYWFYCIWFGILNHSVCPSACVSGPCSDDIFWTAHCFVTRLGVEASS